MDPDGGCRAALDVQVHSFMQALAQGFNKMDLLHPCPDLGCGCCLNECLIWAGRSLILLHSMVYGAAHTSSVTHGVLSKLTCFCPREAYALEEICIFELI